MSAAGGNRRDLLNIAPVAKLVRAPFFPGILQLASLSVLTFLILNGFGRGAGAEDWTVRIVWGLWWPAIIAATLLFGRVWCSACPLEWISRLANRIGDAAERIHFRRLSRNRWLRAGWAALAFYLLTQVAVAVFHVDHHPLRTGVMLAILASAAWVVGLLFREPRAFCKSFCPSNFLLTLYGGISALRLGVWYPDVCRTCSTKSCLRTGLGEGKPDAGCPSLLRPYARQADETCTLCFECVKACPEDNIGFGLGFADPEPSDAALLKPAFAAYVFIEAAFVFFELTEEGFPPAPWLTAAPEALHAAFPGIGFGWWEALWVFGLLPGALACGALLLSRLARLKAGAGEALGYAAFGGLPVVAFAHLTKAVQQFSETVGAARVGFPEAVSLLSGLLLLALAAVAGKRLWAVRDLPHARLGATIGAALMLVLLLPPLLLNLLSAPR